MKSKITKFIQGFLAGFIIGLFGYFGYITYRDEEFSIVLAIIFSLIPAVILGFLLTLDRSKALKLPPDSFIEEEGSFKITRIKQSAKWLAVGSFVLGLISLLFFHLVYTPAGLVLGVYALIRGNKENLDKKIIILAILGVIFALISIAWKVFYSKGF